MQGGYEPRDKPTTDRIRGLVIQQDEQTSRGARTSRYVYFAHDGAPTERVKIGIATDVSRRMKQLDCELLFAIPCSPDFAPVLERALHEEFDPCRLRERSCKAGGGTEWFAVTTRLRLLVTQVTKLGYWPWDYTKVVR